MSASLRRAGAIVEVEGWRHLSMLVLHRLLSPVLEFGRVLIFVRDLREDWSDPIRPAGFEVRVAKPSEAAALVPKSRGPDLATKFDERFRRGDVCLAATDADGNTAHTRWLTTAPTPIPELDMEISLKPGAAYFYDGHTRSDVRGRGIDGMVRCSIIGMLRQSGFERVYSYVQGDNPAGIRAAKRWQRCVGRAWYLRFRGFRTFVSEEEKRDAW